jgi:hypothetical protein
MTAALAPFIPVKIRVLPLAEFPEARRWLREAEVPAG